jgi:hypothetical protein
MKEVINMADCGYYSQVKVDLHIKRIMVERKIEKPKKKPHSESIRKNISIVEAIKLLADEVQKPV